MSIRTILLVMSVAGLIACDDDGGSGDGGMIIIGAGEGGAGEGGAGEGGAGEGGAGAAGGEGGGCVPSCGANACGPDSCGGTCGICADSVCDAGQCVQDGCPDDQFDCNGVCSALIDDPDNCGSCGSACDRQAGVLTQCLDAECILNCPGMEGEAQSIDFARDTDNCGGCGVVCPDAQGGEARCVEGECASPCRGGELVCDGACVDPQRDASHCGVCGVECGAGATCNGGDCECDNGRETLCDDGCYDLDNDPANCAACGNRCEGAEGGAAACVRGECQNPCADVFASGEACDGACVDTSNDPAHCGACGANCAAAFEDFNERCIIDANAERCSSLVDGCGGGTCQVRITHQWDLFIGGGSVTCDEVCTRSGLACGLKIIERCAGSDELFDPPVEAAGCVVYNRPGRSQRNRVNCDSRVQETSGNLSRRLLHCWCE